MDRALVQCARSQGVRVLDGTVVRRASRRPNGGWEAVVQGGGTPRLLGARFLVVASGRSSLVAGRRARVSEPLVALWSDWEDGRRERRPAMVEGGAEEWFWFSPVMAGKFSAIVFLDPARLKGEADVRWRYRELLGKSRHFRACARWVRVRGKLHMRNAAMIWRQEAVGQDYICVGDSALALDPLSSQGTQTALVSGLQAAAVVHTIHSVPASTKCAIAFYGDRHSERRARFAARSAALYAERAAVCATDFWRRRAGYGGEQPKRRARSGGRAVNVDARVALSSGATFRFVPVMAGELIEARPALFHESLTRPVAFVDGVELAPLVGSMPPYGTVREIRDMWSKRIAVERAGRILDWLLERGVLEPVV